MRHPPGRKRGDAVPSRGNGRCYGCHLPWWAADRPVSVGYGAAFGQFAMGEGCWHRASVEERLEAHRWVCQEWAADRGTDRTPDPPNPGEPPLAEALRRIEVAIRTGDLEMWRHVPWPADEVPA